MGAISKKGLCRRTIFFVLFVLPIVYVAEILGVAVHEILGHGLSTILLGGKFFGFILKWDAMGWAFSYIPPDTPLSYHICYLASGIIVTTILGGIIFGLVFLFNKRIDIQLTLIVISFVCLMDGIPYLVWNSYHPVLPGDIGRIIALLTSQKYTGASAIRWILFTIGIVLFIGITFNFCISFFSRIEKLILNGEQFTGKSRILGLVFYLVLPVSVGWLTFDWNQLTPGIGRLPNMVGVISVVAAAMLLFWYRPQLKNNGILCPITLKHIIISWICLIIAVIAIVLWFKDGIIWG